MPSPNDIAVAQSGLRRHATRIASGVGGASTVALLAAGAAIAFFVDPSQLPAAGTALAALGGNALASWLADWAKGRLQAAGAIAGETALDDLAIALDAQLQRQDALAGEVASLLQNTDAVTTAVAGLAGQSQMQAQFLERLVRDIERSAARNNALHNATLQTVLLEGARVSDIVLRSHADLAARIDALTTELAQPRNQTINVDTGGGDYAERDVVKTVVMPGDPLPAVDLDAAKALLVSMPVDTVPDVSVLPPGSVIFLSPNPLFTGRTHELRQLAAALKQGRASAVTAGMGGVGKTTVASEFVHRYGRFFAGGVFWLSFADPNGVESEIARCGGARGLRLPAFSELVFDDQVQRVLAEWQSPVPRLLVFDNCEDAGLAQRYRPKTGGCCVLITSRNPTWPRRLGVQVVELDTWPRHESMAFLREFRTDMSDGEASTIAEELGDLPLALFLAGSFLEDAPHIRIAEYLAALTDPEILNHPSLQGHAVRDEDPGGQLHVGRAFALSFERLNPENAIDQIALKLLARAACLAPGEPFPRSLLLDTIARDEVETNDELQHSDAVRRLISLGLLEQEGDDTLKLHRLLCRYAQRAVPDDDAEDNVIRALSRAAHRVNMTAHPGLMQPLVTHLAHLASATAGRSDELVATLLNNYAYFLDSGANYAAALPLYERALAISETVLGAEHPSTATSLNNLAGLHYTTGNYAAALPLYERALAIREKVLGAEHPSTQTVRNNTEFARLPNAIADAARLDPEQRQDIEATLEAWQARGYLLRGAADRIWAGERDLEQLTDGLDATDTRIIAEVLRIMSERERPSV